MAAAAATDNQVRAIDMNDSFEFIETRLVSVADARSEYPA
jgi:hypothetical protein